MTSNRRKYPKSGSKQQFLLTDIPPALRDTLVSQAERLDTSIANIVCGVLARDLYVPFEPSDRHLRPEFSGEIYTRPSGQSIGIAMNLRLPPAVMEAVRADAHRQLISMRSAILTSLAEAFDLEPPEIRYLNGKKRAGRPRVKHGRPKGRMK